MALYNTLCFFMVVIYTLLIHSPTNVASRIIQQDSDCAIGEIIDCNPGTHESIVVHQVGYNDDMIPLPCDPYQCQESKGSNQDHEIADESSFDGHQDQDIKIPCSDADHVDCTPI